MEKRKKTGGRVKGTLNKVTANTKSIISEILKAYQDSGMMSQDFAALEPKDRLIIAEKLMQYTVPKLQAVAYTEGGEKHFTIEDKLRNLMGEDEE